VARQVVLIAVRVGIAGRVEPVPRHVLGVPRRFQQALNPPHPCLVLVGGADEILHVLRRRRQAGQGQRQPPQLGSTVGPWQRLDALALQAFLHKGVHHMKRLTIDLVSACGFRHRPPHRRRKRPVILVNRPGLDPLSDQVDLFSRQLVGKLRRRHLLHRVGAADAMPRLAGLQVARHDRPHTIGLGIGTLRDVEAQVRLALGGVKAVAIEASVGEDRTDMLGVGGRFEWRSVDTARLCGNQCRVGDANLEGNTQQQNGRSKAAGASVQGIGADGPGNHLST